MHRNGDGRSAAGRGELMRLMDGYIVTQLLRVAVRLGVADVLAERPCSAAEVADAVGVDGARMARILRGLAVEGVLDERPDGDFALTEVGGWLRTDLPGSVGGQAVARAELYYAAAGGLLEAVRDGGTAFERLHGEPFIRAPGARRRPRDGVPGVHAKPRGRGGQRGRRGLRPRRPAPDRGRRGRRRHPPRPPAPRRAGAPCGARGPPAGDRAGARDAGGGGRGGALRLRPRRLLRGRAARGRRLPALARPARLGGRRRPPDPGRVPGGDGARRAPARRRGDPARARPRPARGDPDGPAHAGAGRRARAHRARVRRPARGERLCAPPRRATQSATGVAVLEATAL
jgi:hypothetical protein